MTRKIARWTSLVGAFAAALLASRVADAGGFSTARFGSDHGNPMTGSAYAVYFNPASLGGIDGSQLTLDLNVAYRRAEYTRSESALSPKSQPVGDPVYRDANTGNAHLTNVLASPFGGVVSNLGTKFVSVGFASYIPFGGVASWDKNDKYKDSKEAPGAVDGPQRWHGINGSHTSWYNTLAVAFTIPSARLSFGLSGSYVRHSIKTIRARNADSSDDMRDSAGGLIEGRSLLNVSGSNFALGLGVYFEPKADRSIRVGASYLMKPNFGEMRLKGKLDTQFGNQKGEQNFQVDLLQTYPDIMRAGVAWRVNEEAEVRLDGDYTRWSAFNRQCVVATGKQCNLLPNGGQTGGDVILALPRDWRDTFGARLGASLWASPLTEIWVSGAFDTAAVPSSTIDAVYLDSFKVIGAVGVRRKVGKNLLLATSYNHVAYLPVETSGKSTTYQAELPSRSPSANGRYEQSIIFINANATVLF